MTERENLSPFLGDSLPFSDSLRGVFATTYLQFTPCIVRVPVSSPSIQHEFYLFFQIQTIALLGRCPETK